MSQNTKPAYAVGQRVCPATPDGYHLRGIIVGTPGFFDPFSGKHVDDCYSINFECADNHTENLWLLESEITTDLAADAAPDLLAACEDVAAWIVNGMSAEDANPFLIRLRAAIAKARGH